LRFNCAYPDSLQRDVGGVKKCFLKNETPTGFSQ
jgi:hypothetical protein